MPLTKLVNVVTRLPTLETSKTEGTIDLFIGSLALFAFTDRLYRVRWQRSTDECTYLSKTV